MDFKTFVLAVGVTSIILEEFDSEVRILRKLRDHSYFKYMYIYAYAYNTFTDNNIALFSVLIAWSMKNKQNIKNYLNKKYM